MERWKCGLEDHSAKNGGIRVLENGGVDQE